MLLKWILKLIGFGFLLGTGSHCGDSQENSERVHRARQRAARRLHRFADAIANFDDGEEGAGTGE